MDYKDYIDLGFERIDMKDAVEFERTGYSGFCLTKKLVKKVTIEVCYGSLDTPKLYIERSNEFDNYTISLTPEMLLELLGEEDTIDNAIWECFTPKDF